MEIESLAKQISANAKSQCDKRYMVAIAGSPASGKSTLAEKLKQQINQHSGQQSSEVIPMDGFHLDNDSLDKLQLRPRKGAENTFDSEGFVKLVNTLHTAKHAVSIPLFDRNIDATIPDAKSIYPEHQILLIEGNYLLLNSEPWTRAHEIYDYTIFIKADIETVTKRLIDRWLKNGYDLEGAKQRALSNDIPNAEFVLKHSVAADMTI